MFKLNLKIAWRNLWKSKGYTFINILGLSIGMASCILIFIFIRYQLSFDENFKNEDRIYRVITGWTTPDNFFESAGTPRPLPAAMRNDFKQQFDKVAAIQAGGGIIKVKDESGKERIKTSESVHYAEPDFFEILSFKWLEGNPRQSLSQPNTVVLSDEMADKLFGDWHNAVGKSINFQNKAELKVTGIIEKTPDNSSFPLKVIISYKTYQNQGRPESTNWGTVSSTSECYVLLKEGASIEDASKSLPQFVTKYYKRDNVSKESHRFQPLRDIHYNADLGNFANKVMPTKELYGLAIIGAFLLLTACINFINLATSQAVSRGKEVGVRKVMGSLRRQLIVQFLTETLTITVISLLVGCVLTEAALPGMQSLFKDHISFSVIEHPIIFVFMVVLVLLVSFLAGFYPAMVMSGYSPVLAIKNKITANAAGLSLRKILVVVQFAITIILIIGTLVVLRQMSYMREKPLGFIPTAVALIDVPSDSMAITRYHTLQDQINKIPGVLSTSYCSAAPSSDFNNESNFRYNGTVRSTFQANTKTGDENYFKTFGLEIIVGKGLSKSDTLKDIVVNETMLKKLNVVNYNEAIGKSIRINDKTGNIIGVVKDFNNMSLHEPISPIVINSDKESYTTIAVKLDSKSILPAMRTIEKTWNTVLPEYVYGSTFMDDKISEYYQTEKIMGALFKVFAGVIIFISFIGLFGLISFVATQRTREVAIRKVLGASTLELVKMLNGSFLLMVFLANLVAWPLAYLFVAKWLATFSYRIDLNIWPFVFAMIISMVITLITVSIRSYKAAVANTIDALKYE